MKDGKIKSMSISVNIPEDMGNGIRELAYRQKISLSSIVEIAIADMLKRYPEDSDLAEYLHKSGASRRRSA